MSEYSGSIDVTKIKDQKRALELAEKLGLDLEIGESGKLTGRIGFKGLTAAQTDKLFHEGWMPRWAKDITSGEELLQSTANLDDWDGSWINKETNAFLRKKGNNWSVELQGGQKNLPSGFKNMGTYALGKTPEDTIDLFHEKVADAQWTDQNPGGSKRPAGWGRKPIEPNPAAAAEVPATPSGARAQGTLAEQFGDDLGRDALDVAEEAERPMPSSGQRPTAQPRRARGPIPLPPRQSAPSSTAQANPWVSSAKVPTPAIPTLSQTMDPNYRALPIDSPEGQALRQMRRGQQAGMYAKIPFNALGRATQLGGNSMTMNFLSGLAGGGASRGGRLGMAYRGAGRLGILAGLGFGGKMLYDMLSSDEQAAPAEAGTGTTPGQAPTQLTPDVAKSREAGSKAFLGGLTINDKAKFSSTNRKYLMGLQDSKVTQALRTVASGENAGDFNRLIKDVVTGKRDAAELNNRIVMAMGSEAKQGKVTYLPNTYKLGGKEYMMGIDNTEGAPRLVRMAMDGTKVEFDPYKPEAK